MGTNPLIETYHHHRTSLPLAEFVSEEFPRSLSHTPRIPRVICRDCAYSASIDAGEMSFGRQSRGTVDKRKSASQTHHSDPSQSVPSRTPHMCAPFTFPTKKASEAWLAGQQAAIATETVRNFRSSAQAHRFNYREYCAGGTENADAGAAVAPLGSVPRAQRNVYKTMHSHPREVPQPHWIGAGAMCFLSILDGFTTDWSSQLDPSDAHM